jgi:3-oxoadipate enol-lactonase
MHNIRRSRRFRVGPAAPEGDRSMQTSGGHCDILNSTQAFNSVAQMALRSLLALRQANVDFDLMVDASLPWLSGSTWLRTPRNLAEFKAALRENPMPQSVADQVRQLAALAPFDSRE